jgi:hypothetical protein
MTEFEKTGPDVTIRYVGSLLRRLFIIFWVFWLAFCVALSLYGLVKIFSITDIEVPRLSVDTTASVTIPESVVTAYKSGIMTTKDKRQFEEDLRSGLIVPPKGTSLKIPSEALDIFSSSVALLAFAGISFVGIVVLQYLIFGFINPQRLYRRSDSAAFS